MLHQRLTFLLAVPLAVCTVLLLFRAPARGAVPQADVLSDTVVDPSVLHLPGASWNTTVNGMAFQQHAIASHNGWQYTTWWDSERRLCIARRPSPSGAWQVIRFEDYTIRSSDTHNVTVLGICAADGAIHLAFDHHGHPLHYRVSRAGVATRPESHKWTADLFGPVKGELEPGKAVTGVTYPRFIPRPDGGLQLMFRQGGSGQGDWMLADYKAGQGWSQPRMLISGAGKYGMSESRCAYLNGIAYDAKGRMHLSWVWRESGDPMTNHDLCYAYSDDGGDTWKNGAGKHVASRGEEPLSISTPGICFQRVDMFRGLMNSTTQTVDSRGRVHIVTFHLMDETPSQLNWEQTRKQCRYMHYWRDTNGQWRRTVLGFMGTRPQVCADSADNLYLVVTGDEFIDDRDLVLLGAASRGTWGDWREVKRLRGPFTGQPQLDRTRGDNVLAVYLQEYPDDPKAPSSPLRVIEFRTGTQR